VIFKLFWTVMDTVINLFTTDVSKPAD